MNRSASVGAGRDLVSVLDGGSVKAPAAGDLLLDSGASIAANAGAVLSANNTLTGGKGGAIDLGRPFPQLPLPSVWMLTYPPEALVRMAA